MEFVDRKLLDVWFQILCDFKEVECAPKSIMSIQLFFLEKLPKYAVFFFLFSFLPFSLNSIEKSNDCLLIELTEIDWDSSYDVISDSEDDRGFSILSHEVDLNFWIGTISWSMLKSYSFAIRIKLILLKWSLLFYNKMFHKYVTT